MRFASALLVMVALTAKVQSADDIVDYVRDIRPLFQTHCVRCHGPDDQNAELRLDTAELAIAGGNSGPAIIPGDVAKSRLLDAIRGTGDVPRMPPEGEFDPLTTDQIAMIRRWIEQGALHPAEELSLAAATKSKAHAHWAFRPIVRPEPPANEWPTVNAEPLVISAAANPIDAFILAQLQDRDISPSPQADRATLIRRVSLDLTGLPPTLAEIDDFVNDRRAGAYDRVVDRLLASPHYGERWGRWWLDQARYADSDGYSNDGAREMWRYRDWVIEAFNRDLPFDEFVVEQLAGDLLPGASLSQRVATGFHRNTQTYSEGDSATEEYRVENVVDRVHTTGVVLMGLTLGCARCHDHKFDPISQREFHELFAFFNNQEEPRIDVPAAGWTHREDASAEKPPMTSALVMAERETPRETHIHLRGDFLNPGRQVFPGVPAVLPPLPTGTSHPTRLDLARWLISPEHPLTSRVIANRMWQVFFGRGLVETDDDFGTQGEPATHPELLDWLASEFQRLDWSNKSLHRLIVTSAAYRQSSDVRPDLTLFDPRNALVARQNRLRLDAELVRDATLAASGLLVHRIGGPSVFPPQPPGVMRLTQHADRVWNVSQGDDRYRRGMYTFFWRLSPHPLLMAFNAPEANATCTRRPRANTPVQSLMLLNDEAFVEAAQALAIRVLRESPSDDVVERARYGFRLCLGREPQAEELAMLAELLEADAADTEGSDEQRRFPIAEKLPPGQTEADLLAWTTVARVLLNLDEFITRE